MERGDNNIYDTLEGLAVCRRQPRAAQASTDTALIWAQAGTPGASPSWSRE